MSAGRRLRSTGVRAALVAMLLSTSAALAQSPAEDAARALFKEGLTLHESRQYAPALEKYRAAYARWKNPKILANIGSAAWELGRFPEAAAAYDAFLGDAPADDPTRLEVQKALAEVLPKVGTLDIRLEGNAAITVDGHYVEGPRFDRVRVMPGAHSVEAVRAGGVTEKQAVEVAPGATAVVVLSGTAAGPSQPSAPAVQVDTSRTGARSSALPWFVGGIGVAGLATSGVLFALRGSAVSDLERDCIGDVCPSSSGDTLDRAKALGLYGAVTLGVGIVGIGASVYLFSTGRPDTSDASTTVHVGLSTTAGAPSAVARLRF